MVEARNTKVNNPFTGLPDFIVDVTAMGNTTGTSAAYTNLVSCGVIKTDANGNFSCGTASGSGTVTSITQGTGMSFSVTPITGTGTINLATPVSLANGGTNATLAADTGAVAYSSAAALALLASTATASKMLLSGSSAAPTWSTSTIPSSAGATANKVLLSDGTNYALSTPTFPNASATSGKYIKSDGTNWIASTGSASGVGTPTACSNQFVTGLTLVSDAAPTSTCTTATLASAQFANQGTTTTVLHGNGAGNPSFAQVSLATDVSGNLPVGNLNSGTGATGTDPATYWRGDASWSTPQVGAFGGLDLTSETASYAMGVFSTGTNYERWLTAQNMDCTNLEFKVGTAPGASKSWVGTVQKAGVDTAITCTISGASATTCAYTGATVQFLGNTVSNRFDFNVVAAGAPAGNGGSMWSMICNGT